MCFDGAFRVFDAPGQTKIGEYTSSWEKKRPIKQSLRGLS